jgi:hypothetical protein
MSSRPFERVTQPLLAPKGEEFARPGMYPALGVDPRPGIGSQVPGTR